MGGNAWATYKWEEETWPEFRAVDIDRKTQIVYLKKLLRHFKTGPAIIQQSTRRGGAGIYYRGGRIWGYGRIKLGKICSVGTLCHEFAHHLNWCRNGKNGHGKQFKRELKRVYTWAKRWLPVKCEETTSITQ